MTATRYPDMLTLESVEKHQHHKVPKLSGEPSVLPSYHEPTDAWSDSEIGRLYRLVRAGWDTNLIAETMDIPANEVAQKAAGMLEALERRKIVSSRSRRGTREGQVGRPRQVSEEQEERILRLHKNHIGATAIAAELGLGVGCVRYILGRHE
jgi:hypothetical protein